MIHIDHDLRPGKWVEEFEAAVVAYALSPGDVKLMKARDHALEHMLVAHMNAIASAEIRGWNAACDQLNHGFMDVRKKEIE